MADRIHTPTSVIARALNEQDKQEGTADAAIDVATGVVTYKDADGNWRVRQVAANEDSKRVAREARDPPMSGMGSVGVGASPLDETYDADTHAFTVGFQRYDRARVRISEYASGDPTDAPVGWDENGHATDADVDAGGTAMDTPVARGIEVIERENGDNLLLIEFY